MGELIYQRKVEKMIFIIREQKVMLDSDLAELFGVQTKYLNRQVKRNIKRFPQEFMFRLTVRERDELVTIWHQSDRMKHSYVLPYAFTEHGVAMLASVLNSPRAVRMSIIIIKTFVKLREFVIAHKEFAYRLRELEYKVQEHDIDIQGLLQALKQLIKDPDDSKRVIRGFAHK